MLIAILISIAAGVSIVVARIVNSNLSDRIGLLEGTFFNYVVGLFFSFIFLLLSGELLKMSPWILKSAPIWTYLGGIVGVVVVASSNFVTPKISAFYLTLIIFIGQLFSGVVIDYFTIGQVSSGKFVGGLLVLLGLTYNLFIDKKDIVMA